MHCNKRPARPMGVMKHLEKEGPAMALCVRSGDAVKNERRMRRPLPHGNGRPQRFASAVFTDRKKKDVLRLLVSVVDNART